MAQNDNYIGVAMGLDVTDLKSGIREANKQIELANSAFRAASSKMDDWRKSTEGVSAKITQLDSVLEMQNKKLDGLNAEKEESIKHEKKIRAEYDETVKTLGKQSEEAEKLKAKLKAQEEQTRKLTVQINNQTSTVNATERELKNYRQTLDDAENGTIDLEEVTLRGGKAIEKLDKETEKAGDGFTVMKGAVASLVADGIAKLVDMAKEGISTLMGLADATREYREDIGKLKTAYESANKSTELATEIYKEFYSVLGEEDRSVEAVNHLAKLVNNEKDMAKWADIAAGVWGTFGDSLPIEGLTEAANEVAKVGKITGVLADAINWSTTKSEDWNKALSGNEKALQAFQKATVAGMSAEDAFNEALAACNTEQERATLITDTLNGLYADAAKNYKANNKSIIEARKATSDYTDTMADLGEAMEPVSKDIAVLKSELAKELAPVVKRDVVPAIREFIKILKDNGTITKFAKGVGDLAKKGLPTFADILGFIVENVQALTVGLGAAAVAFGALSIISIVTTAIQGATTAMGILNAVMAANPVGAVITAVVGLVAVLGTLISSSKNAKTSLDYVEDAFNDNIEANRKWQEVMDSATVTMGDFSDFANKAGETVTTIKEKMTDAQKAITEIWAAAFEENRELRADEIAAIKQYNLDYIKAQNELVLLEQQKYKAQVEALQWRLDNMKLSEEEEQGILNTLSELRTAHLETLDETVATELVLLEQRYANEQISLEEYNRLKEEALAKQAEYAQKEKDISQGLVEDTIAQQAQRFEIDQKAYTDRVHYYNDLEEIRNHYSETVDKIYADEELNWWEKYWAKQRAMNEMENLIYDFTYKSEAQWTDYNFLTDKKMQENERAFFNWIANNKANGVELDETSRNNAAMILDAYASLPKDLQDTGLDALRGLAEGLADEYPSLERAADMNMKELLAAMNDALGIHSPSVKMKASGRNLVEGISSGMNSKVSSVLAVATSIAGRIIGAINKKFETHSPSKVTYDIGGYVVKGLANGIKDAAKKNKIGDSLAQEVLDGLNVAQSAALKKAQELGESILSAAQKGLSNKKVYQTVSLKAEMKYWDAIRKEVKAGTQARIDADANYYAAKKAYEEKALSITTSYASKIDQLQKSYTNAVDNRTREIVSSMGLFDTVDKQFQESGSQMTRALQSQVDALNDWRNALDRLEARGIDADLFAELEDMGADATGYIKALASMSDAQLDKYVSLWQEKNRIAKEQAREENEELRAETEKEIAEIVNTAFKELSEIGADAVNEYRTFGMNLMKGISEGFTSEEEGFYSAIVHMVNKAISTARSAADIHSPSRLAAKKIGVPLGQGFGVGILDSIPSVKRDIQKFNNYIADNLGNVKNGLRSGYVGGGAMVGGGGSNHSTNSTVVNAGMTVNYNGSLSRKQLKQLENDNYTALKTRLRAEGAI